MDDETEELYALYLAATARPGTYEGKDPEVAARELVTRFPRFYRYLRALRAENALLRSSAAAMQISRAANSGPIEFAGFTHVLTEADGMDLDELAQELGLLIGDEFVVTERYARLAHYTVCEGPTHADPLRPFTFNPAPPDRDGKKAPMSDSANQPFIDR